MPIDIVVPRHAKLAKPSEIALTGWNRILHESLRDYPKDCEDFTKNGERKETGWQTSPRAGHRRDGALLAWLTGACKIGGSLPERTSLEIPRTNILRRSS